MKNLKKLSKNARDLYYCFTKGVAVGGNETDAIKELLEHKLIIKIKKGEDKGKYTFNHTSLN